MSKRPKDMSQKELEALPEYSSVDYEIVQLPDDRYPDYKGDTVRVPKAKKGYVTAYDTDDILFFMDSYGDTWKPVYDGTAWAKERWTL